MQSTVAPPKLSHRWGGIVALLVGALVYCISSLGHRGAAYMASESAYGKNTQEENQCNQMSTTDVYGLAIVGIGIALVITIVLWSKDVAKQYAIAVQLGMFDDSSQESDRGSEAKPGHGDQSAQVGQPSRPVPPQAAPPIYGQVSMPPTMLPNPTMYATNPTITTESNSTAIGSNLTVPTQNVMDPNLAAPTQRTIGSNLTVPTVPTSPTSPTSLTIPTIPTIPTSPTSPTSPTQTAMGSNVTGTTASAPPASLVAPGKPVSQEPVASAPPASLVTPGKPVSQEPVASAPPASLVTPGKPVSQEPVASAPPASVVASDAVPDPSVGNSSSQEQAPHVVVHVNAQKQA